MAKKQSLLNKNSDHLFHKISGSQSQEGTTQPIVGSPAPFIGAIARAGIKAGGNYLKKKGSQALGKAGLQLSKVKQTPGIVPYVAPKASLGSKIMKGIGSAVFGKVGLGVAIGSGVSSLMSPSSGDDSKKKPTPTPSSGKKYDTNMKDFALNSQARRDEYTKRGWKQDDTTTIKSNSKPVVKKETSKPVVKKETVQPKPSTSTSTSTPKIKSRKEIKKDKLDNKANLAAAQGNYKKANRLNKRSNRVQPNVTSEDNYMNNLAGAPMKALKDLASNLGQGENQIDPNSKFGEKIKADAGLPFTSNVQDSVKAAPFKKANCKYRK